MTKDLNSYPVWTAIISPMNEDGTIDYESYEKLLREQAGAGNAVVILGSTGESLNISEQERRDILDFALSLKLDIPYMVGVGGSDTEGQRKWIEYLNTLDVDAYLVPVPMYAKPGVHGQYGWFKTLLDAADRPCMLYNVPGRTAKPIELEALRMLGEHPRFWAIKESSASEEDFAAIRDAAPHAHMMSGDDPMLPAFAPLGAKGVVSVAANAWPKATHVYAEQCLAGTLKERDLWQDATESLFVASNPVPVKALLADQERIKTPIVRTPLSEKDMTQFERVRQADENIQTWMEQQA